MDWPVIIKQKVCPVKKTSETHAEDQPVLTLQEILYTSASKRKRRNST